MTMTQFLNKIADGYDGKMKKTEGDEIVDLLMNLTDDEIDTLYSHIKRTYDQRSYPKYPYIYKTIVSLGFKRGAGSGKLHPQSPWQMVVKYQDRSCEWLIETCRKIRRQYDYNSKDTPSARVSFLSYWEILCNVHQHDREKMKQYIIANDKVGIENFLKVAIPKVEFKDIQFESKFKSKRI